jgi:transcription antitermination factor NusG
VENDHLSERGEALPQKAIRPTAVTQDSETVPLRDGRRWFAVYTTPRHEKRVSEHFKVRAIDAFLPLCRVFHRWNNGCKVLVELPLFPSYVFVRADRQERARVVGVPGVLAIVGSGREPSPLPDCEIEALRSSIDLCKFEPYPYLVVGERARIKAGPMAGIEGVLVRKKNNLRVVLTLDLIMQSVAVEVDACDLEPIPPPIRDVQLIPALCQTAAWRHEPTCH